MRSRILYLGVVAVAVAVFTIGLLRAPYFIELNAETYWAIGHLGAPILVLAFVTARLAFPKWWTRARLGDRLWWPFLASCFLTLAVAELAPYANAHLGPQPSVRIHGTVRRVVKPWRQRPYAEIDVAGQNRVLQLAITWEEWHRLRPGMAFHETYQRGGLGLLYRQR